MRRSYLFMRTAAGCRYIQIQHGMGPKMELNIHEEPRGKRLKMFPNVFAYDFDIEFIIENP